LHRILLFDDREIRLLNTPAEHGVYRFRDVHSHADAVRLLSPYQYTPHGLHQLRLLLADEGITLDAFRLTDDQVIDETAWRIVYGRVRVAKSVPTDEVWFIPQAEPPAETQQAPAPPPKQKKLTWIEVQVFNDVTKKPYPWVRMTMRLPTGEENYYTTDGDGTFRVDDIEPGSCDVWCDLHNAQITDTLHFVGDGKPAGPPPGQSNGRRGGDTGIKRIAEITEHKVKKGESIASLAEQAGMKWQELAYFNWGTSVPDEINKNLHDKVGCSKKTRDGKNYMFDDTDKPGIMLIPKKWSKEGLATGQTHPFRVKPIVYFPVILENEWGVRIPEAAYEAELADGSKRSGTLGLAGVDAIKDPPPGKVVVLYKDYDDILPKSLAAMARKSFDDRDYLHLWRVLKHDPKTLKKVCQMYDKYYNDLTGKGLVEDVYAEITDEDALIPLVGLMALGELPIHENRKAIWHPEQFAKTEEVS
jgi:hypothetical protein